MGLRLLILTHHNNGFRSHSTLGSRLSITGSAVFTSYVKQPRNQVDHHRALAVRIGYILNEPQVLVFILEKEMIYSYLCQEMSDHVNVIVGFGHLLHSVCA